MNCPNCGQALPADTISTCSNCGQVLPAMSNAFPNSSPTPINELPPPTPDVSTTSTNAVPPAYPYPYAQYPYPAGSYVAPAAAPSSRKVTLWIVGGVSAAVLLLMLIFVLGGVLIARRQTVTSTITVSTGSSSAKYTTLFKDPLTSPIHQWTNDTHCFFGSDGYHDKGYICFAPIGNVTNGIISEDVKQIAGTIYNYHGIAFRRTSPNGEYIFDIDSNGYWHFGKNTNAKFTELIPFAPNPAIHTGLNATNSLKVIMNGTNFIFFINGVQVGQINDSTYVTGRCGVSSNSQAEAVFTNFEVDLLNA